MTATSRLPLVHREPWLVTLAAQLTPPPKPAAPAGVVQLLGDVAGYRHRWDITHPDPLGLAADWSGLGAGALLALSLWALPIVLRTGSTFHEGVPTRRAALHAVGALTEFTHDEKNQLHR